VIQIGPYTLNSQVVLAPMAGVTDRPFRLLCRHYGAAMTPSEMLTSNIQLWNSEKNRLRRQHSGETSPRVVQIAGSDPQMMAQAARLNVDQGAQIIDINMGCPAKKVLKKAAGSALLKDEKLVKEILHLVVNAVSVPVSLKIRTGWGPANRNGTTIAKIAEDSGIKSLAVHGRTRECMFRGEVEYDTIAAIKEIVEIPVFANGDIDSPQKAAAVLSHTLANGVMIGRAAQGRPWIFQQIDHYLKHQQLIAGPSLNEQMTLILTHLENLYDFYGSFKGVLIARKHVAWYCQNLPEHKAFRAYFNTLDDIQQQTDALQNFFSTLEDFSCKKAAA
jgi:tRNA-dihydrouridine synthase B